MMSGKKRSFSTESDVTTLHKEWDEVMCPICIEHPYNAVLLLCSSHGKGCRPYVCDTSYRHSNCLDRYRKSQMDHDPSPDSFEITEQLPPGNTFTPRSGIASRNPSGRSSRDRRYSESHNEGMEVPETEFLVPKTGKLNLQCPLCRGDVKGWKVIEEARTYVNMKTRSCSRESCSFMGNYSELRRHARSLHPFVRPAEVDPSRQQAWSELEHQREYDDIISAIQSATPNAVTFGDYVVEDEDEDENNEDMIPTEGGPQLNGSMWATLLIFQLLRSMETANNPSPNRRSPMRHFSSSRSSVQHSSNRRSSVRQSTSRRSSVQHSSSRRSSVRQSISRRSSGRHISLQRSSSHRSSDPSVTNDDFPAHRRRRLTRTRYTRDQH